MSPVVGAAAARVRLALVSILAGAGAFLLPSLLGTTVSTPSAAVLATMAAVTVAAVVALNRPLLTVVSRPPALPPRHADRAPSFLAERVTDTARHPLRPRAPGLV